MSDFASRVKVHLAPNKHENQNLEMTVEYVGRSRKGFGKAVKRSTLQLSYYYSIHRQRASRPPVICSINSGVHLLWSARQGSSKGTMTPVLCAARVAGGTPRGRPSGSSPRRTDAALWVHHQPPPFCDQGILGPLCPSSPLAGSSRLRDPNGILREGSRSSSRSRASGYHGGLGGNARLLYASAPTG